MERNAISEQVTENEAFRGNEILNELLDLFGKYLNSDRVSKLKIRHELEGMIHISMYCWRLLLL